MSSNPLYGLRKVGTFVQLTGLPGRPVRHPVFAGCTRWLCDRRLWLVTKSTLEACIHDDALYKLTIFTFTFTKPLCLLGGTDPDTGFSPQDHKHGASAACLFTSQLSLVLTAPTHGGMARLS